MQRIPIPTRSRNMFAQQIARFEAGGALENVVDRGRVLIHRRKTSARRS